LRSAIHLQMITPGKASRDLSGPQGLTTEAFVKAVRDRLEGKEEVTEDKGTVIPYDSKAIDMGLVTQMFQHLDTDNDGSIDLDEFVVALKKLGITPKRM